LSRRLCIASLQRIPQCCQPNLEFVHAPPEKLDFSGHGDGMGWRHGEDLLTVQSYTRGCGDATEEN
jgi:hypothetical protein